MDINPGLTLYAALLSTIVFVWNVIITLQERNATLNCWLRWLLEPGKGVVGGPDIYYYFTNTGKRDIVITHAAGMYLKKDVSDWIIFVPHWFSKLFRFHHKIWNFYIVNEPNLPHVLQPSRQFSSKLELKSITWESDFWLKPHRFYIIDTHGKEWFAPRHAWGIIKAEYQKDLKKNDKK